MSPSPTLSRFEPPRLSEAVRASTIVNPWATSSLSPSSASTTPREAGGIPSVLVDNPWNTSRTPARPSARRLPLEDAFAVGGMEAALPALPPSADPLGMASKSTSHGPSDSDHHGLPADPTVALPMTAVPARTLAASSSRGLSASASSEASSAAAAPPPPSGVILDAVMGSSLSAADGEAQPRIESGGSSQEMDPLGVGMQ